MRHNYWRVLSVMFVVLALLLGGWSFPNQAGGPNQGGEPQGGWMRNPVQVPDQVDATTLISDMNYLKLTGKLGQIPGVQERIDAISAFTLDVNAVTSASLTDFDRQFVEEALTSNSLELWSLYYSLKRAWNPELRSLIKLMITMHSNDQKIYVALAQGLGMDTTVDFVNASVYPETPDYDLGMRTQNLKEDYLMRLVDRSAFFADARIMYILDQEHAADIETELTAERTVTILPLKALSKHAADVTELHMLLMDNLASRIIYHFRTVPVPEFQEPYMDPYQITVNPVP